MITDYYKIPYSTIKGGAVFTHRVDKRLSALLFNTLYIDSLPPKRSRTKLPITGNQGSIISMRFLHGQTAIYRGSRYTDALFKNAVLIDLELTDKSVCIHFYDDKFILTGGQAEHHIEEAGGYLCDHINEMHANILNFLSNPLKHEAVEYIKNNCFELDIDDDGQEIYWASDELLPDKYDFCRFLFAAQLDVYFDTIVDLIEYLVETNPDDYAEDVSFETPTTTMVNHNTSLEQGISCYQLSKFIESYYKIEPRFSCYYDPETKPNTIVLYWNYEPEDYGIVGEKNKSYKVSFTIGNAGNIAISGRNKQVNSDAYDDLIRLFDNFLQE